MTHPRGRWLVFSPLLMAACLWLTARDAPSPASQVTPPPAEPPRISIEKGIMALSVADQAWMKTLPLLDYQRVEREFEKQAVAVEIWRFAGLPAAFSAFTFFQHESAKEYGDRGDCILQHNEMLFWQGPRMVRSTFRTLRGIHLKVYLQWLRTQLEKNEGSPPPYLNPPAGPGLATLRRVLVVPEQVTILWPDCPPGLLQPGEASPVNAARFRYGNQVYWAGYWHRAPLPAEPTVEAPADGGNRLVIQSGPALRYFYFGPAEPALILSTLAVLQEYSGGGSAAARPAEPGSAPAVFRRDNYSYGDLLLRGFQLVALFLGLAILAGVAFTLFRLGVIRLAGGKTGMDRRTVNHLDIDPREIKPEAEGAPERKKQTTDGATQ